MVIVYEFPALEHDREGLGVRRTALSGTRGSQRTAYHIALPGSAQPRQRRIADNCAVSVLQRNAGTERTSGDRCIHGNTAMGTTAVPTPRDIPCRQQGEHKA